MRQRKSIDSKHHPLVPHAFLLLGAFFPTTWEKFRFSGSIYSMPNSFKISSSVSAFTSSQNFLSDSSASGSCLPFNPLDQRHSPNSFKCIFMLIAFIRISRLNSMSPVSCKSAAPREDHGTRLKNRKQEIIGIDAMYSLQVHPSEHAFITFNLLHPFTSIPPFAMFIPLRYPDHALPLLHARAERCSYKSSRLEGFDNII